MADTPNSLFKKYRNAAVTETKIKIRGGRTDIFGWNLYNSSGSTVFLQLFNKADTADVILGTTIPDEVIVIAANAQAMVFPNQFPVNQFPLGLVIACTSTATGSSAPAGALNTLIKYR